MATFPGKVLSIDINRIVVCIRGHHLVFHNKDTYVKIYGDINCKTVKKDAVAIKSKECDCKMNDGFIDVPLDVLLNSSIHL